MNKKEVMMIIIIAIIIATILIGIGISIGTSNVLITNTSTMNSNKETIIKYSAYDYVKDKVNDYNGVYSKNIGNATSSILIVEDKTNLILMVTKPRITDGGKDVSLVDFTNMKVQNTSYNKYGNEIIVCNANIDKYFKISSASTHDYTVNRDRTYISSDTEWKQIQNIVTGIGTGVSTIIEGNNGKSPDLFGKTIQQLKNIEYTD